MKHGGGGCWTTQSIYQQPPYPTTWKCLRNQSQPRQAGSPIESELAQRALAREGSLFPQAVKPMGGKGPDPDGRETESHAGEDIHPGQEDLTGAHQGKRLQAE